jgi:hypothetical protein
LLNLIFVFFIPLGGKSRFGRGARRWSALTLKPRPQLLMKACALEIIILLIYLSFSSLRKRNIVCLSVSLWVIALQMVNLTNVVIKTILRFTTPRGQWRIIFAFVLV